MTDRFIELLKRLGLTPSEFADTIGVQRSTISHILSGRNKPSIDLLEKTLASFPETDIYYLITGKLKEKTEVVKPVKSVTSLFQDIPDSLPPANDIIKKPEQVFPAPADYVIIVYKNNTFRMLKPSGEDNP